MTELLKMPQVAEVLGVGVRTAERMAAERKIPVVNIGTGRRPRYRVDPDALAQHLRDQQIPIGV